jgi:lysozyme family protein
MVTDFQDALRSVLVHEGGKVDHPKDPGGRTNQGVIQRVYSGYRRRKGLPDRDVFLMSNDERDEIYRIQYWDKIRGDELPVGVAYVVFDGAVNSGPVQSVKWLQRVIGVRADGLIGEATLSAVALCRDHDRLIADICEQRMRVLKALKTYRTFGRGWRRRVEQVQRHGQAIATGTGATQLAFVDGGNAKADVMDARGMPSPVFAAVGGASGGGGLALLAQLRDHVDEIAYQLSGFADIALVQKVLFALTIGSALLGIGGLAYGIYAKTIAARRAEALGVPA